MWPLHSNKPINLTLSGYRWVAGEVWWMGLRKDSLSSAGKPDLIMMEFGESWCVRTLENISGLFTETKGKLNSDPVED